MADSSPTAMRMKTGVPGLDDLLGGGLLAGRSLLLKGAPGSGKTTLGLQMLVAGAARFDEPGILLTFEQLPQHLYADARGFGWDLEALAGANRLRILFVKPHEILEQPGRQENRLLAAIDDWVSETGARRILIDSISHLRPLYTGEQARALLWA
ncbi:MAG: AAA family ATPase [Candidatus Sumerlaeota bacterium]|nr:AAA family ATPase [Candidatus Sumerlaeota bacterium]